MGADKSLVAHSASVHLPLILASGYAGALIHALLTLRRPFCG
jgi:hypothetical protein